MNLKPPNAVFGIALAIALSVIGSAVAAQTPQYAKPTKPPTSTAKKATMSLPETPHELWSRILLLLKKQHGYTSKKDVEDTLGIRFKTTEINGEKRDLGAKYLHSGEQELTGLGIVTMSLFEDPKWSRLMVNWGSEHSETSNCIKLPQATHSLAALGWDFASTRSVMPGRGYQPFFRLDTPKEEIEKAQGNSDDLPHLLLFMPNQLSQCVNGFGTNHQRP